MLRIVTAIAVLAIGATAMHAQNAGAIAKRRDTMRVFGTAVRAPTSMLRGDEPVDLAKIQASLKSIQETAVKAKGVFPDDSRTGETDALPAAFKNKPDLMARFDKLVADAKAAESAIQDEASLKAQWPQLMSGCLSCHRQYVRRQ